MERTGSRSRPSRLVFYTRPHGLETNRSACFCRWEKGLTSLIPPLARARGEDYFCNVHATDMTEEPMIAGVVFDLDGLIANTEDLYEEVGAQLLKRRGKAFTPELLDAMMGRRTAIALQTMIDWHGLDATVPELVEETDTLFPAILDARLGTMPGFAQLLAALEGAQLPRGVATSSRRSFVSDILSRLKLANRFQFVLTAEDVTAGKPDPEIYHRASERLGVPPRQVMVLEDSENGCRAAVAAGTYSVAVPGGHSKRHNFDGCCLLAESLADPRIYQRLRLPPPTSS